MLLSVVIPVYNELAALPPLLSGLTAALSESDLEYEVVFVDDGSRDGSVNLLKQMTEQDLRIRALFFSRNFGHQAAITAGIDFAMGDAVVVMDADLQDPPELLPEMVSLLQMGYDVVSAQRITRSGDSALKRKSAALFYWIMRKTVDERLLPEVGDFRMFSRRAIVAIRQLREQHRFMRGMVAWLGLNEVIIPFHRHARVAGETKYPLWKMLRFACTAISSFSALPLRLSILMGLLVTLCGVGYGGYIFSAWMMNMTVPGWTSLVSLNIIFSGTTMVAVGLVGEYVARIYEEAKGRPLYVVADSANLPTDRTSVEKAVVLPAQSPIQSPDYEAPNYGAVTRAS